MVRRAKYKQNEHKTDKNSNLVTDKVSFIHLKYNIFAKLFAYNKKESTFATSKIRY
jgi:hypothetical protein